MLVRNRSRAVSKPSLMADHSSQQSSPNQNYSRTIPSLFGSPKFRDFTHRCLPGTEALRSPTSILEGRALSPFGFGKPFSYVNDKVQTLHHNQTSLDKPDSKNIGLALVGNLKDDNSTQPNKGKVLFGTQLRVKIPFGYGDVGTKSHDSSSYAKDCSPTVVDVPSWSEIELSEEYTCVISHGPNPRTTHIFNNCILETYSSLPQHPHASANFLSFCYTCKKHLEHTKDIFIYRGEKAFCSTECRHREMVLDGVQSLEFETSNGYV